ncbi:MAG: ribokinase [Bryobacteraceae bacterium]
MPQITVVGSLNMDFVVSVDRLPSPGETVLGRDFRMFPGGKGANQACAAGRLGGRSVNTRMIGRVGHDIFADHLKASLAAAGVDVGHVHATRSQSTGVALIWVDRSGQNSIVVASGANHALFASEVPAMRSALRGSQFALFQLESPLDTVSAALQLARAEGVQTILDPAPAQPLTLELLKSVDILTPNETEASILLGLKPGAIAVADAPAIAGRLREMGPKRIVLKLGEQGCFYLDGEREIQSPGFSVKARDTTGAGDTFNAALAVALAQEYPLEAALRFANAAAAISVTRVGAQASIPTREEVAAFLASRWGEERALI